MISARAVRTSADATSPLTYGYAWAGLALRSNIELPELAPCPLSLAPSTNNHNDPIDIVLLGQRIARPTGPYPAKRWITREADGCICLHVPDLGIISILGPRRVEVALFEGARCTQLRGVLVGPVLGAIAHWRNMLPLHACSIGHGQRSIAFAGDSGAGKSTLAAFFAEAGYPLYADDITILRTTGGGDIRVSPNQSTVKLLPDSIRLVRIRARVTGAAEIGPRGPKSVMQWPNPRRREESLPLSALMVLERRPTVDRPTLTRQVGSRAVATLMRQVHRAYFADLLGTQKSLVAQCIDFARRIDVFDLQYGEGEAGFVQLRSWLDSKTSPLSAPNHTPHSPSPAMDGL